MDGPICGGHPLAGSVALLLCARCTGIWLAAGAGFLLPRTSGRGGRVRWLAVALAVAVAPLHVVLYPEASDFGRFAAGAFTGAGIAALLGSSIRAATLAAVLLVALAATRVLPVFFLFWIATPVAVVASLWIPSARLLRVGR